MLTKEQIDTLFAFCEKHRVRHYDVQMELVDHLANAIEDLMNVDKALSVDEALDTVYKGFGPFGFARMVVSRAEAMERRQRKERRRLFFSYFTWPKIGLTLLLVTLFIISSQYFTGAVRYYIAGSLAVVTFLFEIFVTGYGFFHWKSQVLKLSMTATAIGMPNLSILNLFLIVSPSIIFSGGAGYCSPFQYVMLNVISMFYLFGSYAYIQVLKNVFIDARIQFPAAFVKS